MLPHRLVLVCEYFAHFGAQVDVQRKEVARVKNEDGSLGADLRLPQVGRPYILSRQMSATVSGQPAPDLLEPAIERSPAFGKWHTTPYLTRGQAVHQLMPTSGISIAAPGMHFLGCQGVFLPHMPPLPATTAAAWRRSQAHRLAQDVESGRNCARSHRVPSVGFRCRPPAPTAAAWQGSAQGLLGRRETAPAVAPSIWG